ncbi:UDP-glucuronosyltransferase 2C1-like [Lineus longissimus]|uniref:UDP-glucuronosyltransferase 2C1-like n=1 Tax=Lineus longissimus TaxID=88925 RepID=UPI00315D6194
MERLKNTILIGILVAMATRRTQSSKILLIPVRQTSHIMEMNSLAIPLMSKGHKVTMVLPDETKVPTKVEKSGMQILRWQFTNETSKYGQGLGGNFIEEAFEEFFNGEGTFLGKMMHNIPRDYQALVSECHGTLGDHALNKKLRAEKFDLVIVDGLFMSRCFFLIPFRMGVPYIGFSAIIPPDIMSTTYILNSITPSDLSTFGTGMTFFQRLLNILFTHGPLFLMRNFVHKKPELEKYADGRHFDSLAQLISESKLWLVSQHPLLDFPKPKPSFVIPIGGLNPTPPKPLPEKIQAFVDKSKGGMVIISFGGSVKQLPQRFLASILEAANKLPNYSFLMRNKEYAGKLPSNVMMVDWLPQNDALGHPKTKLFITHCGSGGQHEALYHGVPMLGFPGIADQFHNAARMVERGYGLKMSLNDFTTEELVANLKTLLNTETHRMNIKHAAEIMHNPLNKPDETLIYWIEHVMKYGGDHLKINSDLNWFQILMWDICLFLLVVSVLIIWINFKILQCCYRKCCAKRSRPRPKAMKKQD